MQTTERNQLIEAYLPLAHKLAFERKKHLPKNIDFEDLKSAAYYGLVDAAVKFDSTKSNFFGTYAKFRILGEIYDWIRKSYLNRKRFTENDLALENVEEKSTSNFEEEFEEMTKNLSHQNKHIIKMYVNGMSLKEIGLNIGVSESRISQILKQTKGIQILAA